MFTGRNSHTSSAQGKIKRRTRPSSFASGFSTRMYLSRSYQHRVHIVDHVCGSDYQEFPIPCTRSPGEYRERKRVCGTALLFSLSFPPSSFFSSFSLSIWRTAKLRAARSWQNVSYEYESQECKHVDTFYLRVNVFPLVSLSLSHSSPLLHSPFAPPPRHSIAALAEVACKFESAKQTGVAPSTLPLHLAARHTNIHIRKRALCRTNGNDTLAFIMY